MSEAHRLTHPNLGDVIREHLITAPTRWDALREVGRAYTARGLSGTNVSLFAYEAIKGATYNGTQLFTVTQWVDPNYKEETNNGNI
jgi:hypothetical protein